MVVIEVREVPGLRRLDAAVEGDEQAGLDESHGVLLVVVFVHRLLGAFTLSAEQESPILTRPRNFL